MAFPFHYMTLAVDKLNDHGLSNNACIMNACQRTLNNVVLATELPGSSNKLECFSYKGESANL